ncbi:hypothetical protein LCGC14_0164310 [marine sediment metagenome]|uniref:Uncharacterized protein n=1 Tax=marine sediment metagenome TaxID=412755 RepID=A0A0F9VAM0_9ZZZZ
MPEDHDWKAISQLMEQASVLAQRYNLCIWNGIKADGSRHIEAYRMKRGEKDVVLTTPSMEKMIEKLTVMAVEGKLEHHDRAVEDIDPEIWHLHIDSAAFNLLHKTQDLHQTFSHLIGPVGLVYDRYCVIDMQLRNLCLSIQNLTSSIRKVPIREREKKHG